MTLADRIAADYGDRLRTFGERAPGRFVAEIAGLTVVGLGVDEPWGVQIVAMPDEPRRASVDEAVRWCADRGFTPEVVVRGRHRQVLGELPVLEDLAAFAAPAGGAGQDLLDVVAAADVEEYRAVYASSFAMRPGLAETLVVAADLTAAGVAHLVGRVDGRAVACAQVRAGAELALVAGVGVVPDVQKRGYGTAMLAACRAEAARRGCTTVWLNAAPHNMPFYEGIGFEVVDTHVALGASV